MAQKIFSHAVIWNGEYVPANTPIEVAETTEKPATVEKNAEEVAETATTETKKPTKRGVKGNDK